MKNVMQEKLEVKKCVSSELYTGSRLFWFAPQEEGLFNLINPSLPLTKIFIFTLLCDASSFYKGLKDLHKTLWSTTKKCENIIICVYVKNQTILEPILC